MSSSFFVFFAKIMYKMSFVLNGPSYLKSANPVVKVRILAKVENTISEKIII